MKKYNPGSLEAIDLGCTCPVLDNGHGNQEIGDIRGFWISEDCKLHNPSNIVLTAKGEHS